MNLPRRKWIVESRTNPALVPALSPKWTREFGPFFRKKTAEGMRRRFKWFAPEFLIETRIREL